MKRSSAISFGSLSSYRYGTDSYDSTKLGLGELMVQLNNGGDEVFAGPAPIRVARPVEQSTSIPSVYPWAMQWQDNSAGQLDWIFLADNAAAAATRRINAYSYNRRTAAWSWQGFVTVTFPIATNITIRGLRMTYDKYTTGTVAVSGTAVTGTGTTWNTGGACVGNRIGFGSTDPTQITTWYEISAIGGAGSITLNVSAGTIAAGTAYVIEDLRAVLSTTNATTTNGGLFVCKGLNWDRFNSVGGTVPAATTVDNIRACYWLADASTVTNITATGLALAPITSISQHDCYVVDGTSNPVIFKYNLRAALTLTSGKATNAFTLKTGSGGSVTGAIGQLNNSRLATAGHGPLSGVEAVYFTTASRIYAVPTSLITSGSTTFISSGSVSTEVPPGGTATIAASGGMSSIEHAGSINKFIITTNATNRMYLTQYRTDGGQFDRAFGIDTRMINQAGADSSVAPALTYTGAAFSVWAESGMVYFAGLGTTAILNVLYAVPIGADWEYAAAANAVLVTPAISCPDASSLERVFTSEVQVIGGRTDKNLGYGTEPYKIQYRTSGITDNSGSWTDVSDTGAISGASTSVQFRLLFRTIGLSCLPARITGLAVTYEDVSTDSHYQFSATKSDATNKRFAWRHSTAFGGTVPTLTIRLYDAVTGSLLLTDNTATPTLGTWQKATDGSTWGSYNTTDRANETTYIRYTPTTLADNINVRPVISQG